MDASLSPVIDKASAPIPEAQLKIVVAVRNYFENVRTCAHHDNAIRI
jgi:hypothetical protein